MTRKPPPSLAALRAFAAAGRLQSLRDAARELNVTASAVSHHVRAMEDWLNAPLFLRSSGSPSRVVVCRIGSTGFSPRSTWP